MTFVVVAVNALSILAMVVYPLNCVWLGLDERTTGDWRHAWRDDPRRRAGYRRRIRGIGCCPSFWSSAGCLRDRR